MHDPMTLAFEIKYPWKYYRKPTNNWERNFRDTFANRKIQPFMVARTSPLAVLKG